jgi:acetolactate synthase-1/2/3 large subunit
MAPTGGDGVNRALRALGVDTIFGIASVHNVPIIDAIQRGGEIRFIATRQEGAAVHAADGYARTTGRLGVALASTGPGTTNTMTGLYEAGFASTPVLLITGQAQTRLYGQGKGYLHQAEQQVSMLATVCRRVESPRRPDEVVEAILRVADDVRAGRPQPGAVEIPLDLQHGPIPDVAPEPPAPRRVVPDERGLADAVRLLESTQRRLLWAGGGVLRSGAGDALVRLTEALDAPVLTSVNGRGAIPEDHRLALGAFSADPNLQPVLDDADVLLAVGTRFQWQDTANFELKLPDRLIHLDADPTVIGRTYEPSVRIVGDARLGLERLLERVGRRPGDETFPEAAARAAEIARSTMRAAIGPDYEAILDHLRERLPRNAPVVRDPTVPAYRWANRLLPVFEPGLSIQPTCTAIGPGLPLALGAAIGTGEPTLVIHGDGGFMLHVAELATAAQYEVPVKICVFNDGGYGVLRAIQQQRYEGRMLGVDLHTPDFAALAQAMGVPGEQVRGVDQFRSAFDRALEAQGPYLLDIDMSALHPMVAPPARPAR